MYSDCESSSAIEKNVRLHYKFNIFSCKYYFILILSSTETDAMDFASDNI